MGHKTRGLRIATRCSTLDQFVTAFHRFCDPQTVFISTMNPRAVGLETAFSIDLADHQPALRGVGVVLCSWATPQNPYGRPGIQLGIRRLTADSEAVFARLLVAKPASFGDDKTEVSGGIATPLLDGERTPGSDLVLPANPLMNISDHSLEGFVDCTLYEETGNFFGEQPVIEDPDDPRSAPPLLAPRRPTAPPLLAPPPRPPPPRPPPTEIPSIPSLGSRAKPPPPIINKLTPPMGASPLTPVDFTPPDVTFRAVPQRTSELANDIAGRMTPPPLELQETSGPPAIPGKPWISAETAELLDIEPDPPLPAMPAMPAMPAAMPPPMPPMPHGEYPAYNAVTHASGRYDALAVPSIYAPVAPAYAIPPHRAASVPRRRWVIGATAGATLSIAVALVASGSSQESPAAVPDTAPVTVAAATLSPPPKLLAANTERARMAAPVREAPVGDATSAEPATPTDEPRDVVGKGPCKIAVSTTPAGSMVSFDGEPLGPSPLTVAGPCTRRRIDVAHPRYAPAQRFITPKPDDALDLTLVRPTHDLVIESQPAGAVVSIDGHRAGTTPTIVKITGFTTLEITVAKPGYKAATKKLYSKTPSDRLSVKLAR